MRIVLSLNYKYFEISPFEIFTTIKENDYLNAIKGVEIGLGLSSYLESDMDYIMEMAKICKEYNLIFNLHAPTLDSITNFKAYLDYADTLQKIYGRQINIVVHSINKDYHDNSVRLTDEYLGSILEYIQQRNYNLSISVENLNIMGGKKRLIREDLLTILNKYPDLKFTYDVGHEMIDHIKFVELSDIINYKINNVHIHSYKDGTDHHPLGVDEDVESIQEFIKKLNTISYKGPIVLEYAFEHIEGNDIKEKIVNYIKKACELQMIIKINENKVFIEE